MAEGGQCVGTGDLRVETKLLGYEQQRTKGQVRISGGCVYCKECVCWETEGQEITVINAGDVEGPG